MFALAGGVLLVFALALSGTATPEAEPQMAALPPVIWELIELPGSDGEPAEVAEPERYTIQFLPEDMVAIKADCNRAGGGITTGDGLVTFEALRSTLALCPPGSQADPFMAMLVGETTFTYDDDGNLILENEQGAMRLRPTLVGVVWDWRIFQGGDDSIVEPDDPELYTLEFLPEGRLAIRADCNRGFGTYAVDGPAIELKVMGLTRAFCPPDSRSERFVRDIEMVSSHVFRDGGLHLALPVDAGILSFEARNVPPDAATPEAG